MNKNIIIAGIAAALLIIIIVVVLVYPTSEPGVNPENDKAIKPDIEQEVRSAIEKYIAGNEQILDLLKNSEKHREKFIEMLESEPAFTLGMRGIIKDKLDFKELVFDFASKFKTPELYSDLIDLAESNDVEREDYLKIGQILASGGDDALDAIFRKHYDLSNGRLNNFSEMDKLIHFFSHYNQLRFWITKYDGKEKNEFLNTTALQNYNNSVEIYSTKSMRTQLELFTELKNPKQQAQILWALAPNRMRPEWYSWFVPMLGEAVSSINVFEAKDFYNPLVEILNMARRDMLIDQLEDWLKNNPSENLGYKNLKNAVEQGRTLIERYRANNSLRTNEFSNEEEPADPDANMLPVFNLLPTNLKLETFDKLAIIYNRTNSLNNAVYSGLSDYNFEIFNKIRKQFFLKPYLFEIAHKANIKLKADSWRNMIFSAITQGNFNLHEDIIDTETAYFVRFFTTMAFLWDYKQASVEELTELFNLTKELEEKESQIAKFLQLAIIATLAKPHTTEQISEFLTQIKDEKLTEKQRFSLVQALATNIDASYNKTKLSDFNPYKTCLDSGLISDYRDVLNVLSLKKHKFSEELIKSILTEYKNDETIILAVFNKVRGLKLSNLVDDIAKFLNSNNPIILAKAIEVLPFSDKYIGEFEKYINSIDPAVKIAAAVKMLASSDDSKVLNSIAILKQEQPVSLWQNLWIIKNVELIKPLIFEVAQKDISTFGRTIKLRSDLLSDDSIFDTALFVYKDTDDVEVQADILRSLLTRDDKVEEILEMAGKNKETKIRKIAWDFAKNNPKKLTIELILLLLDGESFKIPQEVLGYLANNPKWIEENKKIKDRVLQFLDEKKDGLEYSAVFALIPIEKDPEISSAFCRAISKRVLWPVSAQIWMYIMEFENIDVANTMLDIISNEKLNSTDFASSYLVKTIDKFKGLRQKIYDAYENTDSYKVVVEMIAIFVKSRDKGAAKLLVNKDYTKLTDGQFSNDMFLPVEVAHALSAILGVKVNPEAQKKEFWTKYLK